MLVLISYDVRSVTPAGRRRLRRIAKICLDYGQRVQFSVFECKIAPDQWITCRTSLLSEINPSEDSLRFYFLGANWQNRVEHHGAKAVPDLESDSLIV